MDGRCASTKPMAGKQHPKGFGVDLPSQERGGVEAAPAVAMRRFETQVNGGRYGAWGEDGVGELEESVGPGVEAVVERATEGTSGVESVGGVHGVPIMHSPTALSALFTCQQG